MFSYYAPLEGSASSGGVAHASWYFGVPRRDVPVGRYPDKNVKSARAAELALIAVTLVWGTSFTLVKAALEDAPVSAFLSIRFALASLALLAVHRFGGRTIGALPWRGGAITGMILAVSYIFQTAGLRQTAPSKAAFLTALCTVLVPFFGALVYRSVPRGAEILGVTMAMVGTGLMTLPGGDPGTLNRGDLLTLGCAASFAVHILTIGHFAPRVDPVGYILVQVLTVAALSGLWHQASGAPGVRWSGRLMLALGVTSILCTALAYSVQAWAQRETSSTRTALIFTLEPVAASVTSYLVTGEVLPAVAVAGALLILGGVLMAELQPFRWLRHP